MTNLSRDQILAADDLRTVEVEVPEWGGAVRVRTMTAGERDRFDLGMQGRKLEDIRAKLVAATACDGEGRPLFGPEDIAALTAKASAPMARIFDAAAKLNGILPGDVEELEKN